MFLEISQNSQKNNCGRVSFLIKWSCRPQAYNFVKKRLWYRYFPMNFAKFLRTPFCRTAPDDYFWSEIKRSVYHHWSHFHLYLISIRPRILDSFNILDTTLKIGITWSFILRYIIATTSLWFPVDTGRKLNVLCTFNLRPVSTGLCVCDW